MKRALCMLLLVGVVVVGLLGATARPAAAATQPKFTVYAAASLYKAFPAMVAPFKAQYRQYRNVKFVFSFQGSDVLATQIMNGAQPDLFASASTTYVGSAWAGPFVNGPRLFCQNRLCVITPAKDHLVKTLADLTKKGVVIAIGDATVPIGKYTRTVLTNMSAPSSPYGTSYSTDVLANVQATVSNVNMVTALVSLDQVDAGFVYLSDKVAAGSAVTRITIPATYQTNPLPTYPIASLKTTKHPLLAKYFIHFARSAKGQAILRRWGFLNRPSPVISSLTPTSGAAGSTVAIAGTNFFSLIPGTVKFGTTAATATWAPTAITATVPTMAAGPTKVTVTSDGVVSKAVPFTVTSTP